MSEAHWEWIVADDVAAHAALAAELLARDITEAVLRRGVARIALSGGNTPLATYVALAALALPFDRVEWYWVDERAVPPAHTRSNFGAARRSLRLDEEGHGAVYRMEGEGGPAELAESARRYEALLRARFGVAAAVRFDAVVLGIGSDGHTASLFPRTGAVRIEDRLVASTTPGGDLEPRITLTAPVLVEAAHLLVLARGPDKAGPLQAAQTPGDEDEVPARILGRARGRVSLVVDSAARGPTI